MKDIFVINNTYTREDVKRLIGVTQKWGNWSSGYARHAKSYYTFSTIGERGLTGPNYENKLIDDYFHWYLKSTDDFNTPTGKNLLSGDYRIMLFIRYHNKDPFTFTGYGMMVDYGDDDKGSWINWRIIPTFDKGEIKKRNKFIEGKKTQKSVNIYERNRQARQMCLNEFGYTCSVCAFDFEKTYGDIGQQFIHVHHLKEISRMGVEYELDPIRDLRPVCPNCHAMLHRRNPIYSIEELKSFIKN